MASLFSHVFSCCLRARSRSLGRGEPNERTHLIPTTEDISPLPSSDCVVDPLKMKERLGTIVHTTGGKMVNVGRRLPFNLHNKNQHPYLDPSSSRSRGSFSGNRTPPRPIPSNSLPNPFGFADGDDTNFCIVSRDHSIQTSRSTSSLRLGDASYTLSHEDDELNNQPILNVRLVGGGAQRGVPGSRTRRGRSTTRGRLGRFGEERGQDVYSNDSPSAESASPPSNDVNHSDTGDTPHASTFKIQVIGNISRSWAE